MSGLTLKNRIVVPPMAHPGACVSADGRIIRGCMDEVKAQFIASTRSADEYGGSLANRLRHPLEVFKAVRTAWSKDRPMSVRISAHDGVEGGITPDDAVQYRSAEFQMESNFVPERAAAAAGKA